MVKYDKDTKISPIAPLDVDADAFKEILYNTMIKNKVIKSVLDLNKLRRILYEWKLLKLTRKTIELIILEIFEGASKDAGYPFSELKQEIERRLREYKKRIPTLRTSISNARVHLALNRLVKDRWIRKTSRGQYRRALL